MSAAHSALAETSKGMLERPPTTTARGHLVLLLVASALATLPVWIPTYPAMVDLPQHAAQVALLENLGNPDFRFASLFQVNWFTPYLFGYLLIYSLVPLVGVVLASKIVIAVALAALPLATALVMSETGTDKRWALLSIPVLFGFSYQWGFLNFLVAAPLGLCFLALAMRHARRPTVWTYSSLGLLSVVLFFCHAMICGFFCLVAACYLIFEVRDLRKALSRIAPMALVLPVMLAWGLRTLENPVAQRAVSWDLSWFSTTERYYRAGASWAESGGWGWGRTAGLLPRLLGVHPGVVPTIIGVLLFGIPLLAGARPNRRWTVWLPFAACLSTLLFVPGRLFGTDFTFQRFTVFLLPLFLTGMLGSPPPRWSRRVWACVLFIVGAWIAFVSRQAITYAQEARGFDETVRRMAPGKRVRSLIFQWDSRVAIAPTFLHFPAWYSALRGGVVDPSFASTHVELILYRPESLPRARALSYEWVPQFFDWKTFEGEKYHYFLSRAPADIGPFISRSAPCPVRLVHHVNQWWLHERDSSCVPTPVSR